MLSAAGIGMLQCRKDTQSKKCFSMFDTPDLAPCCIAPWIAILVAVLILGIGPIIELKLRKKGFARLWTPSIALLIIPIVCWVSVSLRIGELDPTPWMKPTNRDIVGTWHLSPDTIKDLLEENTLPVLDHELVFKEDGTFHFNNIPNLWSRYISREREKRNTSLAQGLGMLIEITSNGFFLLSSGN
jgi:hypothetical protein